MYLYRKIQNKQFKQGSKWHNVEKCRIALWVEKNSETAFLFPFLANKMTTK